MKVINRHSEWIVFLVGLILMAAMNPYSTSTSWCLIDFIGFTYCPGEGLGHSIAFLFRGEIINSIHANLMGPFVVIGLSFRIIQLWGNLKIKTNKDLMENKNV
tara:strand:+ start:17031 stop:17339 length:309 start_codon:yes stop_codon:yes gene_type:complete